MKTMHHINVYVASGIRKLDRQTLIPKKISGRPVATQNVQIQKGFRGLCNN